MKKLAQSIAASLLALSAVAMPASVQAQDTEVQADTPAQIGEHARLYDVLTVRNRTPEMMDIYIDAFQELLGSQLAGIVPQNKLTPMLAELGKAVRPVFVTYTNRSESKMRPRAIALFRDELTDSEARSVADLYASPAGQRLLDSMAANYRPDALLDEAMEGGAVGGDAVMADGTRAAGRALEELSQDDLEEIGNIAMRTEGFRKFQAIMPRFLAIRVEAENEPMSPDEEAAMEAAMTPVMEKYLSP